MDVGDDPEGKQKIYIGVVPHEERGSTMREREMAMARTLVLTAVLGVAAVLLLAGTAAAELEVAWNKKTALADGVDYIQLNFTVFNSAADTNISITKAGYYVNDEFSTFSPPLQNFTLSVFNNSAGGEGEWEILQKGLKLGEAYKVSKDCYKEGVLYIRINSTEPLPYFTVQVENAGQYDDEPGLDFDATRLNFSCDAIKITAGQVSAEISVIATGKTGNYQDFEYEGNIRFTLNKTADVWLIHDTETIYLPATVRMTEGKYTIKVNGTEAGVYELKANVTEAPWLQNDTMTIRIDPAEPKYMTATVDRARMVAGSDTEYINCTFYILDAFYNVNRTAEVNVNISVSSPAAGTNVTNATAPGDFGRNAMTWVGAQSNKTFSIRIANATMPDRWVAQPYYNITVNATFNGEWLTPKKPEEVDLSVPAGITTEANLTTNSTILRGIEVEPAAAHKIGILQKCSEFMASGQIREEWNITAVIMDEYDNYCIKTTNETGAQIYVVFNITKNREYAYLSSDTTPDGDSPGPISVPVDNTTEYAPGIAVAKIYLWSDKSITESYGITVELTSPQGLQSKTAEVTLKPWFVSNIVVEFVGADGTPKSELVANGTDVAYIIVKLVDDKGNVVTIASGANFTTALRLVYDAGNKSEGWICNKTACASRTAGAPASGVVTAVPENGIIYGNKTEISLYINATATNATAGEDSPIQSMKVEVKTSLPYTVDGKEIVKNANISVAPDEPAKVIIEADPAETRVAYPVTITVTVYDAYNNIVRDDTVVKFRTTSGLIDASKNTSGGQVTPAFTPPYLASTATITAAAMNYARTAVAATNSTSVTFLPSDADLTTEPPVNDYILEVNPATAPADGSTPVTITVSLKDNYGNTVTDTNATVYLSTTLGTLAATQGELVDGVFTTTLTSTEAGTATITANIGNWVKDTDTVTFTEVPAPPYEFDNMLHLKAERWNFISVPKRLNESCDTFNELFNTSLYPNISSILYYDPIAGWSDKIGTDDYINVLDGYWVYTTEDYDIPLAYKSGMFVPPTKELVGGAWNAIGFSATKPYTAEATLKSVDAYWVTAIGWNATAGERGAFEDPIINDINSQSVEMYPGKGYWLFVTENCTLAALSA